MKVSGKKREVRGAYRGLAESWMVSQKQYTEMDFCMNLQEGINAETGIPHPFKDMRGSFLLTISISMNLTFSLFSPVRGVWQLAYVKIIFCHL